MKALGTDDNPYERELEANAEKEEEKKISKKKIIAQNTDYRIREFQAKPLNIQEMIEQTEKCKQVNVQRLQEDYLYLDSQRCAFAVILACSMLTPLSVAVIGRQMEGKTTLINIAKLLVRNCVKQYHVLLDEMRSEGSSTHVRQAVCRNCIQRNYQIAQRTRYKYTHPMVYESLDDVKDSTSLLDYYTDISYPSYHFDISRVNVLNDSDINPNLIILLKDHVINYD